METNKVSNNSKQNDRKTYHKPKVLDLQESMYPVGNECHAGTGGPRLFQCNNGSGYRR